MPNREQVKPVIVLVVAFLALAAMAATQAIQRNFFTVNTAPVVQATAGTNVFVTFTQVGQTRTYRIDVPTNGPPGASFGLLQGTNVMLSTNGTVVEVNVPSQTNGFSSIVYSNSDVFALKTNTFLYGLATFQTLAGLGGTFSVNASGDLTAPGKISFDSGSINSDGLGNLVAPTFHGSGSGLSNITAYATNVLSGGQLPNGTIGLASLPNNVVTNKANTSANVDLGGYGTQTNAAVTYGAAQTNSGVVKGGTLASAGDILGANNIKALGFVMTATRFYFGSQNNCWIESTSGTLGNQQDFHFFDSAGHDLNQIINSNYTGKGWVTAGTTITGTNGVFGAYGCATMSTGSVVVATSISTNTFTDFAYIKTFGGIGSLTNTCFVTTNAGDYRISFGCSMLGGNADQVKTLLVTNEVVCTLIMFEKTMQSPAIAETGFKEVVVKLPANCRVGISIANLAANSTTIQNLCFNVKGAN